MEIKARLLSQQTASVRDVAVVGGGGHVGVGVVVAVAVRALLV